ncbi:DUF3299 domain-containing protein [Thiocapsa marina]|uniref:Lipoprotein n=1 Tax=Thiocapsa marina 5811 TaxID=768671 RepID=F9U892_9GAMM|nr:DUF3299 domain-containing protein [Thiocapsa marina]EGV19504.1 hypothetical protein ThimaDRAFT_0950 [Thiocapsa marina 5811]
MRLFVRLFPVILALGLVGCGEESSEPESAISGAMQVEEIDWDRLIPVEWQPETLLEGFDLDAFDAMDDDDPRATALMDKLMALWADAPVVEELDGLRVRLPGFVVPLELDAQKMSEFLLVPYYGACIHVPPPPANQTVHVVAPEGREYVGELFDTVWVTGTLRVIRSSSELADAGYRIDLTEIEPYDGELEPL